ncbi:unnamed protein product [Meloidogyne enterolobii]|uniref:Uncharacterized protein n=2 Tax=Meloidogyne enterolobii TaxID=390850 RepID=A0ACB0YPK7_MELEN
MSKLDINFYNHKFLSQNNLIINLVDENYILKLPNFQKKIEEMIFVRCWLEKLFKCGFEFVSFPKCVFNPEMINILFDNDKTIPLKFHTKKAILWTTDNTIENVLKFSLNHLSISELLEINFGDTNITEYTNILLNILINEGNKFPKIEFINSKLIQLYDLFIEYIATSKNCSKIVPAITFVFPTAPNFKLSERAEKVEIEQLNDKKITKYQIGNIHNPDIRFSFCNKVYDGSFTHVNIEKIQE